MKPNKNNNLRLNQLEKQLEKTRTELATNSLIASRSLLSRQISGDTAQKHNVWESAGYPKCISFENYWTMYRRGGIAKRIVDMFPDATWTQNPIVKEIQKDEKQPSEFNEKYNEIADNIDLYNKLKRLDINAGIGEYACLLLGFDDGLKMSEQVINATELSFIRVLPQKWCTLSTYNNEPTNTRFGQPETYNVNIDNGFTGQVHHSRILHVAWESLESDYIGVPALESVFNYLLDIEKMSAAEGEGFWKWANPGMIVAADANAKITDPMKSAMKDQIDEYEANLRRTMTSQGFDITQLKSIVAAADKQIDTRLTLIAGTKGAPKRILIGNEAGELASSQDQTSWNNTITERQNNYALPMIINSLINRLIEFGVLPTVDYFSMFPDVSAPTQKELLENKEKLVKIVEIYKRADLEEIIPFYKFLIDFMDYSEDEAIEIMKTYDKMKDDEDADFEVEE